MFIFCSFFSWHLIKIKKNKCHCWQKEVKRKEVKIKNFKILLQSFCRLLSILSEINEILWPPNIGSKSFAMSVRHYETWKFYKTPNSHSFQTHLNTGALRWKSEASVGNVQGSFDKKQPGTVGPFTGWRQNVCPSPASSETTVLYERGRDFWVLFLQTCLNRTVQK